MVTVASRELKNRLGQYLSIVRGGQPLQVTDRGKPIACIVPASTPEQQETAELLSSLLAKGSVRIGSGKMLRRRRPTVLKPGKSIAEIVVEDRR